MTNRVTQSYTYAPGSQSGTTSTRVKTYESKYNGSSKAKFTYEYDKAGNITKQTDALDYGNWTYKYGLQGELASAVDYSDGLWTTYNYSYDAAGNVTSRTVTESNGVTPIVTRTYNYTYGNSDWKDLLTAFDGKPITYDAIGNPTKYYDGSTMVWKEGRRLQSITKNGQTTSFLYDANGQRLKKTNPDGSYSKYCIIDGRVIGEIIYKKTASGVKWDHGMRYIYGDDGSVVGFGIWDANTQNEWERYYFIKNVQGDVLHVYREADNTLVASYEYDPFGNCETTYCAPNDSDHIAEQNPFRYRGYYYDTETGFYYLQSRYYDPLTCRFINIDSYVSTGQDFTGCNMFSYCLNNPVNKVDYSGKKPGDLFDTINEAALDFAICYNELSIADMQEYGSAIYSVEKKVMTTVTVTKTHRFLWWKWTTTSTKIVLTKKIQYSYTKPAIGKKGNTVTPNFLTIHPIVSTVHTHANFDSKYDNENFSSKGLFSDIGMSNLFRMDSYVVTPGGYLKKYTYADRSNENGGVSVISADIPWDVNSPDHRD